ncbi:MAG: leucine--tRNA ligase, partial [Nitrososphaerota archaeon]
HGRTYTIADVHARYKRMKGFNVLLPMAFHYTGTPIIAMVKRLEAGDQDLIDTFTKVYGISHEDVKTFRDPLSVARYFHQEIKEGMKEMGYSIDWRREFTTVDPHYSKFIEWQFEKLRKLGFIVQGSHPVGWCPRCGNPVGQHDTQNDVEPEIGEFTIIKFLHDGYVIPTATLRPETIFGVTNIWVKPDVEYVKVHIDGERWIISKEAAEKLRHLGKKVVEEGKIKGAELVGKKAKNPVLNIDIAILPAKFIDPGSGTGIVMSVPAHAPYDLQALKDIKSDPSRYGVEPSLLAGIEPISIITSPGYGDVPDLDIIRRFGVRSQDDIALEKATSELSAHEFHRGRMKDNTSVYSGLTVSEARARVKEDLIREGRADIVYEIMNRPVLCRCGTECVVKIFENQWFINYKDPYWKGLAKECLGQMGLLPEEIRPEFEYTIEWLREKACARKSGLGTPLPWDREWIIESLSDSVIYMAYYTLAKHIKNLEPKRLDEAFFDYVLLGKGDVQEVAKNAGIEPSLLEDMRREFVYFYPLDSRHSGRDLVPNHLTFFIFNHAAICPKELWPKQIVVNGSVLMGGKKMSKSFGNIVPLRQAVKKYGADPVRLALLATAELLQDADMSLELIHSFREKLERLYSFAKEVMKEPQKETRYSQPDRWLLSRLQRHIIAVTEAMERLRVREALQHIVYLLDQDVQWYMRRSMDGANVEVLRRVLDVRVRLLAPF